MSSSVTVNYAGAEVLRSALDIYTRIGIGQLERIDDYIPVSLNMDLFLEMREKIDSNLFFLKSQLGYHTHGSYGISSKFVDEKAHRAYEIYKALSKPLYLYRNRDNEKIDRHVVDLDGLFLRYTKDPEPVVTEKDGLFNFDLTIEQLQTACNALSVYRSLVDLDLGCLAKLAREGFLRRFAPLEGFMRSQPNDLEARLLTNSDLLSVNLVLVSLETVAKEVKNLRDEILSRETPERRLAIEEKNTKDKMNSMVVNGAFLDVINEKSMTTSPIG